MCSGVTTYVIFVLHNNAARKLHNLTTSAYSRLYPLTYCIIPFHHFAAPCNNLPVAASATATSDFCFEKTNVKYRNHYRIRAGYFYFCTSSGAFLFRSK